MPQTEPARAPSAPDTFFSASVAEADPDIAAAIAAELGRQRNEIELIASENIVSRAVLEAQGSVMTNKYAEGYPGRRYYGGCQHVDVAEQLAIDRVTRLFGCRFANVQPSSGSQANQAVFMALARPGDTILGMSLDAGGHLTHGAAPTRLLRCSSPKSLSRSGAPCRKPSLPARLPGLIPSFRPRSPKPIPTLPRPLPPS